MKSIYFQKFLMIFLSLIIFLNGCGLGTPEWDYIRLIVLLVSASIIYFIIKIIQFVVTAVNLYKEMIKKEDRIISILLEIQNNIIAQNISDNIIVHKELSETSSNVMQKDVTCENCKSVITLDESDLKNSTFKCPICGTYNSIK